MKRPGDKLRFSADLYNTLEQFFKDNPEALRAAGSPIVGELETFDGITPAFANYTGEKLLPGAIVRLADPFPTPEDDEGAFRASPILKAHTPAAGDGTNRTKQIGVVVSGCADGDGEGGLAVIAGLAIVKIKAGDDATANGEPKLVAVIAGDPSACTPTADPEEAFATVVYAPAVAEGQPTYALVSLGACVVDRVRVLDSSGSSLGLYVHYDCEPDDVWHLVRLGAKGYCPTTSGSSGAACNLDGYEPGGTWTSGPAGDYAAAFYSDDCDPPAALPGGDWVLISIIVGGDIAIGAYRHFECNAIAYCSGYTP